jgi:hypothetical protein
MIGAVIWLCIEDYKRQSLTKKHRAYAICSTYIFQTYPTRIKSCSTEFIGCNGDIWCFGRLE